MLNPFSDNSNSECDGDSHYETIDDIQIAVAALAKEEQEKSTNGKSNMPKVDKEKRYSKIGNSVHKVRPPRPKRPASVIRAEKHTMATVETQTSFEKEECEASVIPQIVISENDQTNTSQEETKK